MNLRKVFCILMALSLIAVVFAGCTKAPVAENTPPAVDQPEEPAVDQPEPAGEEPAAETPVDDGTVYKFNVSFAAPEFSTTEITAALDRIQAASNGRIEFTYYYSWSITSVPTIVDDMNSGVVDIAAVPINEHLNLFPYSNLVTYTPFLGLPNMLEAAKIYDELYSEFPQFAAEYAKNGLVYWTNYPCPGYNIFTTKDHAIRVPADMNGLKLITSSSMMQQFISASGGAAVTTPVTEYATSLNTNVVDGVINHANVLRAFGCLDFVKSATVFGEQGTAVSVMMMCFSQQAWDKLPADLQQLFKDEAVALRDGQGGWDNGANGANLASITEAGGTVTVLTDEEIQVWRDAFADILGQYLSTLAADGATDAQAIYDALQTKLARY